MSKLSELLLNHQKEINEQSETIAKAISGRLLVDEGTARIKGIESHLEQIKSAKRFYITGCGSSWHAGIVAKYLLEDYAGIPVHIEYASEFRYNYTILCPKTVIIAISQSGETPDTIASIIKAKEYGALTIGICNSIESTLAKETDCGIHTNAGPQYNSSSTKVFTAQITVLYLLALLLGRLNKRLSQSEGQKFASHIDQISDLVENVLKNEDHFERIAQCTYNSTNFLCLGRGLNYPIALEGALKLKEVAYIHAEGYPAAEMKHGPIALIDENMPTIFIAPQDKTFNKIISNIEQVKARKGITIVITDHSNGELIDISDHLIVLPKGYPELFPILAVIPLQILAHRIAELKRSSVTKHQNEHIDYLNANIN